MKRFVFHVYVGCHDFYEISVSAKKLSAAWRAVPGEILELAHVRAIEYITSYEV